MIAYLNKLRNFTRIPTSIYGLKYTASLEPNYSDTEDFWYDNRHKFPFRISSGNGQFSENNGNLLKECLSELKENSIIVEIGVADNNCFKGSSTECIFLNKKDNTYIGIDIYPHNIHPNNKDVYEVVGDSLDIAPIKEILKNHKIDLLLIDGKHTINQKFKEWELYIPLMAERAVILLHDTNFHSGGYCLSECIDENLFEVRRYFVDKDMGMVKVKI